MSVTSYLVPKFATGSSAPSWRMIAKPVDANDVFSSIEVCNSFDFRYKSNTSDKVCTTGRMVDRKAESNFRGGANNCQNVMPVTEILGANN